MMQFVQLPSSHRSQHDLLDERLLVTFLLFFPMMIIINAQGLCAWAPALMAMLDMFSSPKSAVVHQVCAADPYCLSVDPYCPADPYCLSVQRIPIVQSLDQSVC